MNTAHILAWLTCLALAFFACMLSVRNAGNALRLERDLAGVREQMTQSDSVAVALHADQVKRIQQTLDQIKAEVKALKEEAPQGAGQGFADKLEAIERRLGEVQAQLKPLLGEEKPRAPKSK